MKPFEMGRKNKRDKAGGLLTRQPCILYAVGISDYICQNICGKSPLHCCLCPLTGKKDVIHWMTSFCSLGSSYFAALAARTASISIGVTLNRSPQMP